MIYLLQSVWHLLCTYVTGTRSLFASPRLGLLATNLACEENLAIPSIVSLLSSLSCCQAELLDAASLVHIYKTVSSVATKALSDKNCDVKSNTQVIGALNTIKNSIFSNGVPDDDQGLSVWSEVVLGIAKLSWTTTGKDSR